MGEITLRPAQDTDILRAENDPNILRAENDPKPQRGEIMITWQELVDAGPEYIRLRKLFEKQGAAIRRQKQIATQQHRQALEREYPV